MKTTYTAVAAIALTAFLAGQAIGETTGPMGKTRAEVRAELEEAQRTGDMVVDKNQGDEFYGASGRKLNEIYPTRYPAKPVAPGKTREQVRAELEEARRTGDIVLEKNQGDEILGMGGGRKLNDIYPTLYPAKPVVPGKTREQVRAELEEAQRTGDIPAGKDQGDEFFGGTGRKLNEIYPSRYPAR